MPRATWKKGDKHLSEADMDIETEPRLTKLLIPNAKRSDTGTYELTLTNESGHDTVPIKVTVMGEYLLSVVWCTFFAFCIIGCIPQHKIIYITTVAFGAITDKGNISICILHHGYTS